jgi:hypothetical protein
VEKRVYNAQRQLFAKIEHKILSKTKTQEIKMSKPAELQANLGQFKAVHT